MGQGAIRMRCLIIIALLLGASIAPAVAEVAPGTPAAPGASAPSREAISAQTGAYEAAIADCERMWDRATHMTRQEWRQTCRRVQDRLKQLQVK
jgi:hypothetical protein